jgi:hypothetical protein
MNTRVFRQVVLAAAVAGILAGCGEARDVAAAGTQAQLRRPASREAQQVTGLSYLPRPASAAALTQSLARYYPRELVGIRPRSLVLVDVQLDEQGRVLDAIPVDRPTSGPSNVSIALIDESPGNNVPTQHTYQAAYDPAFGPAARAALREVRFEPAIRDGQPVPYTLRMTVEFISPDNPS